MLKRAISIVQLAWVHGVRAGKVQVSCEKNLSKIAKDGINYTSVYSKVNTSLQKKYKR
jgi:hypothetical protein